MHVIVIEANSGGQYSVDLGNLSDPIGKKVRYSSDGFIKYADIADVVTDPSTGRSVAIAFYRVAVPKG